MALTRDFKDTVVARVRRDPKFARALVDESATLFLNGEPEAARTRQAFIKIRLADSLQRS